MSRIGREALPDVREWTGVPPGFLRGPPGCPGVVGSPTRMFERPSRMSGCDRKSLPNVREWLRGPPECPGVVGRLSRMSGSGWEALPVV